MVDVLTIDSRYLNVALNNFRFGLMASALDGPLELDESIEQACAHRFIVCPRRT
jgi:hypothetical protein